MENNREPIIINGEPVYNTDDYASQPNRPTQQMDEQPRTNPYRNPYENVNIDYQNVDYDYRRPPQRPQPKGTEYGLISMICGILGILFMGLFPFSTALGIVAVVLANKSIDPQEESYKKVGKITGIISIVLSVLLLLFFVGIIIFAATVGQSV